MGDFGKKSTSNSIEPNHTRILTRRYTKSGRCVHADRNDDRRRHNGGAYYGGIPWNKNGDGECADGTVDTGCSQHRDGIAIVGNRQRVEPFPRRKPTRAIRLVRPMMHSVISFPTTLIPKQSLWWGAPTMEVVQITESTKSMIFSSRGKIILRMSRD